jgi:hypothetical protein
MYELKLRRLHRGFLLTDFNNNEVGCKDSEQVLEEIKKLIIHDEKPTTETSEKPISEKPISEKPISEKPISEKPISEKPIRKKRESTVELQRKIFEAAKEQIDLTGKINGAQIARDLQANQSTVSNHLKGMEIELGILIKKWQDERDKKMVNVETRSDIDSNI